MKPIESISKENNIAPILSQEYGANDLTQIDAAEQFNKNIKEYFSKQSNGEYYLKRFYSLKTLTARQDFLQKYCVRDIE